VLQINIGFDFIREKNLTTNIPRHEAQLEVQLLFFNSVKAINFNK
jgi:hypothetical protein